jgi:hypothetical protein
MNGYVPYGPIRPQVDNNEQATMSSNRRRPRDNDEGLNVYERMMMGRVHLDEDNSFERDNYNGTGVTEGMGKCNMGNHLEMDILRKLVGQTCWSQGGVLSFCFIIFSYCFVLCSGFHTQISLNCKLVSYCKGLFPFLNT